MYGASMITIEYSQVEGIYCYAIPRDSQTHYMLHIAFTWNYDANLDSVVVAANESPAPRKEGDLGSVILDVRLWGES